MALFAMTITLATSCGGEQSVNAVKTPELRAVPAIAEPARSRETSGSSTRADIAAIPDFKVGSFERPNPARVPEYEILERTPADRDGAHAVRLLVDTPARTEAEYEFIARDLKALHAGYDAVSVEFTDTREVLDYRGVALIFNTPAGALYIGYVYGPPNAKGYYVKAADE